MPVFQISSRSAQVTAPPKKSLHLLLTLSRLLLILSTCIPSSEPFD